MIDDETLTLFYYDDGLTESQRNQVTAALCDDPDLERRFNALRRELESLRVPADVAAPRAALDRWRRTLDELARAGPASGAPRASAGKWTLWMLPAAAALVAGIAIGLQFGGDSSPAERFAAEAPSVPAASVPVTEVPAPAGPAASPSGTKSSAPALTRGLTDYLQQSQVQLARLADANAQQRLDLITGIVAQNRLFERVATANGEADLARVLRAFEQVLVKLAEEDADASDIAGRGEQLSFEYAVMLTKLSRQPSQPTHSL